MLTNVNADNLTPEHISDAFDEALATIRGVQERLFAVRRAPLTLSRREALPVTIPSAIGTVRVGGPPQPLGGLGTFLVHSNLEPYFRGPELTDEESERLRMVLVAPPPVFSLYLSLMREARLAAVRRGDYRTAAIMAGAAAESFLDMLLLHLMWEECATPADAARVFADPRRGLQARITKDLAPRVGRSWDLTKPGAPHDWHVHVYGLRNRAVHSAYFPTHAEIDSSLDALEKLVAFVVDALLRPDRIARYPRTAISLAGQEGVESRGLWVGTLKRIAEDPAEPDWMESFNRWSAAVDLQRRLHSGVATPTPEADEAVVLAIFGPDGSTEWVLHHRETRMAAPTATPTEAESGPVASSLHELVSRLREHGLVERRSAAMAWTSHGLEATGDWVPEYLLVPEASLMLDRSDPGLRG
jgi:hypothetical protein